MWSTSPFLNPYANIQIAEANLPHWRQDSVLYFITFRLADSLPLEKLGQLQKERAHWFCTHPEPLSDADEKEYWERFGGKIETYLEAGYGSCLLKDSTIACVVAEALKCFHGERYELEDWVIASNHVHVLIRPAPGLELSRLLHSWKSFTAKEINRHLGRSGTLWQKESHDHIVRNPQALWVIGQYIRKHRGLGSWHQR
jgi:REP element-mobilizing transposase RayT